MKAKTRIKVIKRGEKDRQQQQQKIEAAEPKKSAQETARDMVTTVSQWVNEFQQKRRQETAQAFKTLFSDPTPQAGKA
jgi:uncharacterized membrane-anchored protein